MSGASEKKTSSTPDAVNPHQFIFSFPAVLLLYFAVPQKAKNYLLLVASCFFIHWLKSKVHISLLTVKTAPRFY